VSPKPTKAVALEPTEGPAAKGPVAAALKGAMPTSGPPSALPAESPKPAKAVALEPSPAAKVPVAAAPNGAPQSSEPRSDLPAESPKPAKAAALAVAHAREVPAGSAPTPVSADAQTAPPARKRPPDALQPATPAGAPHHAIPAPAAVSASAEVQTARPVQKIPPDARQPATPARAPHHAIPAHAAHLPGLPMDEAPEPDRFEDLFQVARRVITPEIIARRRRARRFVLWTMVSMLAILSLAALIYLWRHAAERRRAAVEVAMPSTALYAAAQATPAAQPEPVVLPVASAEPGATNSPAVEASAEAAAPPPKARVLARRGRVSQPGRSTAEVAAPASDEQETTPAAKFGVVPARTE
jgi:hypothetical protein